MSGSIRAHGDPHLIAGSDLVRGGGRCTGGWRGERDGHQGDAQRPRRGVALRDPGSPLLTAHAKRPFKTGERCSTEMNARVGVDAVARNGADPDGRYPGPDAAHMRVEDFLRRVPILSGVGDEAIGELAASAQTINLKAGECLFQRGAAGDALYLVGSGRLEAVTDPPGSLLAGSGEREPEVIRVLRRGDHVGELALLTGSPRSASVWARRDSALVRVDRAQFDGLLGDPAFVRGLLGGLGEQLRTSRGVPASEPGPPMVIAVVGVGNGFRAREAAEALRERFERWSKVALLDEAGETDASAGRSAHAEWLDSVERSGARALLVADHGVSGEDWERFCVEQADRVLVVTRCEGEARDLGALAGCDLLLDAGDAPSTQPWIAAVRPRTTHRVFDGDRSGGLDRVARRLSGRAIGVVLSGGGARGFAHIGALDVLADSGVEIDRVGGCSMGAIIGGLYASGRSPADIHAICREEFVERNPLGDYTVPIAGLVRGQRAEAMVRRMFGDRRIEDFPRSFCCVTSDLVSSESVVHGSGRAYRLIGASASLPGVTPPVSEEGRLLVDGGVLNNLPVEQMAAIGEGPLIAVDVTARFQAGGPVRRGRPRTRRLAGRAREAVVGSDDPLPRLRETLIRTVVLGSIDTAAAAQAHADAVIEPRVEGFGLTEFGELDRMVEAGSDAAREQLENVKAAAGAAKRRSQRADRPEASEEGIRAHDHPS